MIFYKVRHYWKNGENATWEYSKRVNSNLVNYLKQNYQFFTLNRPKFKKENGYFIYFQYNEKKDIYNRPITNITFYIINMTVIILIFSILIISILLSNSIDRRDNKQLIKEEIRPIKNGYNNFIKDWNTEVRKISDENRFILHKNNSNQFIELLKPFNFEIQLDDLTKYEIIEKLKDKILYNKEEKLFKDVVKEIIDKNKKNNP